MVKIKELRASREEELEGAWYTEERMGTELSYSKSLCCNQHEQLSKNRKLLDRRDSGPSSQRSRHNAADFQASWCGNLLASFSF